MKMAKASKDDIQRVIKFFHLIDEFMEYGTHTPENDETEEESIQLTDEDFVERLRDWWGGRFVRRPGVDSAWSRVVHGCDMLIDNCCDPNASTLEWKPEIAKQLEPEGLEEQLGHLRGNKDTFRRILCDKTEILASFCDQAEKIAKRKRLEPWSVISDITSHGSGVSSAIYELYRRKPLPSSK